MELKSPDWPVVKINAVLSKFEKSTILLNEAPAVWEKGFEKEYSPLFIVVDEPPVSKGPMLKLKILSSILISFPIEWRNVSLCDLPHHQLTDE